MEGLNATDGVGSTRVVTEQETNRDGASANISRVGTHATAKVDASPVKRRKIRRSGAARWGDLVDALRNA